MGREKSRMLEADERGWYEPDGYVCSDCVEDDFLKEIIRENTCRRECDYCGRRTRTHSAAPTATLMESIGSTVFYYYNDPTLGMLSWDYEKDSWPLILPVINQSPQETVAVFEAKHRCFST
jgi:hypothetical protein